MSGRLAGRGVIVTGGAQSLGAAIAGAIADGGGRVLIADLDEAAGAALAARLGGSVRFRRVDITDDEALDGLVAEAGAWFGGALGGLVNNACVYDDQGLASPRAMWLKAFEVNVVSGALLLHKARPLLKVGKGAVVNLSSIAGKHGQAGRALYPSAKAAILQLTRNEAMELAADGIRVNAVSPGWTWSRPLARATGGDRAKADRIGADYHPLGRVGDAAEVAAAVVFLLSDEASFITGADLAVDGGYAMIGPDGGHPKTWRLAT